MDKETETRNLTETGESSGTEEMVDTTETKESAQIAEGSDDSSKRPKKKKMSKGRKVIIIICCIVLAIAIAGIIMYFVQAHQADEIYSDAVEMYTIPTDDDDGFLHIDWDALWAVNPDVCAWIQIPAIPNISYPVIHYTDNNYYLRRSWMGEPLNAGCIMVDYHCSPDFTDFHTIVYGHNMTVGSMAGTMFGQLKKFQEQEFYDNNDDRVIIYTPDATLFYTIFSVEVVNPSDANVYTVGNFSRDEAFSFVEHMTNASEITTNVYADGDDKILTLSTCSGLNSSRRLTVHAVLEKAVDEDGNSVLNTFGRKIQTYEEDGTG